MNRQQENQYVREYLAATGRTRLTFTQWCNRILARILGLPFYPTALTKEAKTSVTSQKVTP